MISVLYWLRTPANLESDSEIVIGGLPPMAISFRDTRHGRDAVHDQVHIDRSMLTRGLGKGSDRACIQTLCKRRRDCLCGVCGAPRCCIEVKPSLAIHILRSQDVVMYNETNRCLQLNGQRARRSVISDIDTSWWTDLRSESKP